MKRRKQRILAELREGKRITRDTSGPYWADAGLVLGRRLYLISADLDALAELIEEKTITWAGDNLQAVPA